MTRACDPNGRSFLPYCFAIEYDEERRHWHIKVMNREYCAMWQEWLVKKPTQRQLAKMCYGDTRDDMHERKHVQGWLYEDVCAPWLNMECWNNYAERLRCLVSLPLVNGTKIGRTWTHKVWDAELRGDPVVEVTSSNPRIRTEGGEF